MRGMASEFPLFTARRDSAASVLTVGQLSQLIEATLEAVLKEEPRPLDEVSRHAPRGVEKLIKRCLRKSPDRRFQSVAEMIGPLRRRILGAASSGRGRLHRFNVRDQHAFIM